MLKTDESSVRTIAEKVIIFLVYCVIFESLMTKYVFQHVLFKYIAEAVIYALSAYFAVWRVKENKKIMLLKHDLFLMMLPFYLCVTSVMINRMTVGIFLLSIRTLYRYILLYFVVAHIAFTQKNLKRILKHIKIAGIATLLFGTLQILLPQWVNPILAPKAFELGDMVRNDAILMEGKAIFSLLERYDRYGIFLVIWISMLLGEGVQKKSDFLLMAIASVNMVYTYSRQAWLGLIAAILTGLVLGRRFFILFYGIGAAGFSLVSAMAKGGAAEDVYFGSPLQRIAQIFSPSYMQTNLETARLRIFVEVLPEFLAKFKLYTVVGLGIGSFAALANSLTGQELYMRYFILFDVEYTGIYHIGDVYWIELVMELGLIGITLLCLYFFGAFRYYLRNYRHHQEGFAKRLNLLALRLIAATIVINFFGPNMLITGYAFFFWLLLGLAVKTNMLGEQEDE